MSAAAALPPVVRTSADVAALAAAAARFETPCGEGAMAWRSWGEGPIVLLVHGGAGDWTHWVRNIAGLVAAGRRVVAPDLPGFGESASPPSGHDADALPPWLELGAEALLGAEPCDVVAFSFGAMVAGFLAAQAPRRVRRLVLVGAPALFPDALPDLGLRKWEGLPEGDERSAVLRDNLRALMLARDASIDALALELYAASLVRDRMGKRRMAKTDVLRRTLAQVHCPVAGIWGADDAVYRHRVDRIAPALAQSPDFRGLVLVPDAGHWVQYEAAGAFDAALRSFLELPLAPN